MGEAEAFSAPGQQKIAMVESYIGFGPVRIRFKVMFDDDTYWSNLSRNRVRLHRDFNVPPSEVVGQCSCQSNLGQAQVEGDNGDGRPGSRA